MYVYKRKACMGVKIYKDKNELIIETKIKPNIKLIYDMKVRGLKDKYIAQALGISVADFLKAKDGYELLQDTYNDAMHILASELTDIVVLRALGKDGRKDKDGDLMPPDEKLAFKILEKIDDRFSTKKEVLQTVTIETIIKSIGEKRKAQELIVDVVEDEE